MDVSEYTHRKFSEGSSEKYFWTTCQKEFSAISENLSEAFRKVFCLNCDQKFVKVKLSETMSESTENISELAEYFSAIDCCLYFREINTTPGKRVF